MKLYKNLDEVIEILSDPQKISQLNIHPLIKTKLLSVYDDTLKHGAIVDKETLLKNAELHFKKINDHIRYVSDFCKEAGIPERGMKHDLSKFSEQELFESIFYYCGTRSPIDACNEDIGWSPAFSHHIQSNEHQLENSMYINGGMIKPVDKTFEASIEVVCDFCGAAKAYLGDKFTMQGELDWWMHRREILKASGTISENMDTFITKSLELCVERNTMIGYNDFVEIWNDIYKDIPYMQEAQKDDTKLTSPLRRFMEENSQQSTKTAEKPVATQNMDDKEEEVL